MKRTWEAMVAYKLVWVRVLLYVLIPSVTTFLSQTETWSGATWDDTPIFLKIRVVMYSALSGAGAMAAFIDQSLQRASNKLEGKSNE